MVGEETTRKALSRDEPEHQTGEGEDDINQNSRCPVLGGGGKEREMRLKETRRFVTVLVAVNGAQHSDQARYAVKGKYGDGVVLDELP